MDTAEQDDDFFATDGDVGEDIKLTKDSGVIKRILAKGSGWEKPEKADKVSGERPCSD